MDIEVLEGIYDANDMVSICDSAHYHDTHTGEVARGSGMNGRVSWI